MSKNNGNFLFTSESVTSGHPDKLADQISDALLDAFYTNDPYSRVAVETLVTTGLCIVAGEVTTKSYIDIQSVIRKTIEEAGYTSADYGFDFDSCGVMISIHEQSPDIAQAVVKSNEELGASDQGLVFGYACRETEELMPLPIMLAHKLCMKLEEVRKSSEIRWLRPDGKSQVTVEYENGKPKRAHTIVVSAQHDDNISNSDIRETIIEKIIKPVCGEWVDEKTIFHINPSGRFVLGGPAGDTGVTGRKIIVDTYGGYANHGGGAYSGKDCTKVDRSASYIARYIAKNIVAAQLAEECEVQLAYAIGLAEPVSVHVNTYGTGKISDSKLSEIIKNIFPLKPAQIIKHLDLRRPIYKKTAAYGHFGRQEKEFTWEKTDKAEELKTEASKT